MSPDASDDHLEPRSPLVDASEEDDSDTDDDEAVLDKHLKEKQHVKELEQQLKKAKNVSENAARRLAAKEAELDVAKTERDQLKDRYLTLQQQHNQQMAQQETPAPKNDDVAEREEMYRVKSASLSQALKEMQMERTSLLLLCGRQAATLTAFKSALTSLGGANAVGEAEAATRAAVQAMAKGMDSV